MLRGYTFSNQRVYKNVDLSKDEIEVLKKYVRDIKQVDFKEFIRGTLLEDYYMDLRELG